MSTRPDPLRVALVAGGLGQGGAEKQLVYLARALHQAGVLVKIFCLTRGEYYEEKLAALGLPPVWIGRHAQPLVRIASLTRQIKAFRPHLLQSTHYFTNLHVSVAARLLGTFSIGSLRSDPQRALHSGAFWSPWLLRLPSVLIANSFSARSRAIASGLPPARVHVLPNVIDLEEFDEAQRAGALAAGQTEGLDRVVQPSAAEEPVTVAAVSRLAPVKQLDLFLRALALARQTAPHLRGVLVGDGSQRTGLEKLAEELGLLPGGVRFLGQRSDVPAVLARVDLLALTSAYEGFPNVLLEAMAARLPVVTVPAGDAGLIVQDGLTGYVVNPSETAGAGGDETAALAIADRLICLAQSAPLRRRLGDAGRRRVEILYSFEGLPARLFSLYQAIARATGDHRLLEILTTPPPQSTPVAGGASEADVV
jgi:glycosyltransferase involved in cell wall biosynthesis